MFRRHGRHFFIGSITAVRQKKSCLYRRPRPHNAPPGGTLPRNAPGRFRRAQHPAVRRLDPRPEHHALPVGVQASKPSPSSPAAKVFDYQFYEPAGERVRVVVAQVDAPAVAPAGLPRTYPSRPSEPSGRFGPQKNTARRRASGNVDASDRAETPPSCLAHDAESCGIVGSASIAAEPVNVGFSGVHAKAGVSEAVHDGRRGGRRRNGPGRSRLPQ